MSALFALMLAQAVPGDPRLISVRWQDNAVVRLNGRAGVESTVLLAGDEHIENIAIGDANAWQVTPNRRANMLFVKPLAPRARSLSSQAAALVRISVIGGRPPIRVMITRLPSFML